jgi:hypothetical protein
MPKLNLFGRAVGTSGDVGEYWHLYRAGRLFGVTLINGKTVRDCYVMRRWVVDDWQYREPLPSEMSDT